MERRRVTLIPGDGIGPEITAAVRRIFEAAEVPVDWEEAEAGLHCIEKYGTGIPAGTMESIARNQVALKGPTTTPIGSGHKSINVTFRKTFDLFANVRPAKSLPGVRSHFENVDLLLVRENIEDTYGGVEHWQSPDVVQGLRLISRPGSRAVMRYTFEMARSLRRSRVTCIHKANIHKMSDGLFLETFRELSQEFPEIEVGDLLIDNACMQLVTRPEHFDVLVLPNLFGDVVSDLCAGLVGGLGVAPGANIGNRRAIFEAVHGSAPDIAGKGIANPTALILSSAEMLRYLGLHSYAKRIDTALRLALVSGIKTRDLGGHAGTDEFAETVAAALPRFEEKPEEAVAPKLPPFALPTDPEEARSRAEWVLHGIDVFIRHAGGLPSLPKELARMRLESVANRGTQIYPGPPPDILLVDSYQARYLSSEPITDEEVCQALAELSSRFSWSHVEKLHEADGRPLYSRFQSGG